MGLQPLRALAAAALLLAASTAWAAPRRHLIVCVDGIGFSTMEKLRAEGRFRLFRPPSRMLAPFPSLTNVSMTEMLAPAGADASPGYEDTFFDVEANRMRGGLLDRFRGDRFVRGTFRELFDYHPSAIKSGLGYALPPASTFLEAWSDLVRLRQRFRASSEPTFVGYMGGTDSLAHLGGERLARTLLSRLDATLTDLMAESGGNLDVTIFSDHGNHFRRYWRVSLSPALARAGLRVDGRLSRANSVVIPSYGLVGAAVLYTAEANEPRAASAAARTEGVDFAAYESGGVVRIVSRTGTATIERRGDRFRYRAWSGDPLGLTPIADRLPADRDGFASDADWLAATVDGPRPDAIRRIYEGLTGHVRNRASVVVSLEDGWLAGSASLDLFAVMRATHGSLSPEQSFGFVMSTRGELPAVVRAGDVWSVVSGQWSVEPPGTSMSQGFPPSTDH